jgi:hypothetical protein
MQYLLALELMPALWAKRSASTSAPSSRIQREALQYRFPVISTSGSWIEATFFALALAIVKMSA